MPVKRLLDKADSTLAQELANRDDALTPSAALDLPRPELEQRLLDSMTIEELRALPEVADHPAVRKNIRADVIAAARGELVEREREEAAAAAAERENKSAPTREEVERLDSPPTIDVVMGEDGSTIDQVVIRRWVLGDDGRPVETEERREA